MSKLRYSEFYEYIDVDAFEAAIGFDVQRHEKGNDIGYCPDVWRLHKNGDTTGKFAIHREKRVYHCWVCGGGSLLSLAMEINDMDVDDATHWLYDFAHGDTRDDAEFSRYLLDMLKDEQKRETGLPYFNERVLEKFNGSRDYFYERGILDEVIDAHKLGTHPDFVKVAPSKLIKGERAKIDNDYHGPVAIFPHFWQDKLVGWQHRWIDFDEAHLRTPKWLAKYTNTTDFPKSDTIFNYDNALKSSDRLVITESVPSVLFLESCGVPAVSTFGANVSDAQLRLLRKFQLGVILCPDNDVRESGKGPGEKWADDITKYLERWIPVYRVPPVMLKDGADLGDFAFTDHPYDNLMEHLDLARESLSL